MIVVAERAGINISGTDVPIMENPKHCPQNQWKNSRLRCLEDVIPKPGEVLLNPFWLTNRQAMSFGAAQRCATQAEEQRPLQSRAEPTTDCVLAWLRLSSFGGCLGRLLAGTHFDQGLRVHNVGDREVGAFLAIMAGRFPPAVRL